MARFIHSLPLPRQCRQQQRKNDQQLQSPTAPFMVAIYFIIIYLVCSRIVDPQILLPSTTIYYHLLPSTCLSTLADHPVADSPAWGALSHLSVPGIPQKETIRVDAWRYKFQTRSNMPIILYLISYIISDITMVGISYIISDITMVGQSQN